MTVALALVGAACSHEKASDNVLDVPTTATSASTSTTAPPTSSTSAFVGATTPTSIASHASHTALLTNVRVTSDEVDFVFRSDVPGVDVTYVDPPITQDGSGKTIAVKGSAFLRVRMEPASGVDMNSGSANPEQTYKGPDRLPGAGPIAEVVRTGDFEANLTWVVGLDARRAYRVDAGASMIRVYFSR
ncbi:MAG: hypothetical protein QOI47_1655 [Actinomycetota bacterium]|nr:hypothetical protein [Actinomycetota bacterium]